MPLSVLFWVIWLVAVLFAGYGAWRDANNRLYIGSNLVVMILLALLGWKAFGPLLQ